MDKVRGLVHDERPAEPRDEAQRQEDAREHQEKRKRRIVDEPMEPFVVGLEEEREENAHDHGHKRRRHEGKALQDAPTDEQHESQHDGEGQHRHAGGNSPLLGWRKMNHADSIAENRPVRGEEGRFQVLGFRF